VILFKIVLQAHTHLTDCSAWTTKLSAYPTVTRLRQFHNCQW